MALPSSQAGQSDSAKLLLPASLSNSSSDQGIPPQPFQLKPPINLYEMESEIMTHPAGNISIYQSSDKPIERVPTTRRKRIRRQRSRRKRRRTEDSIRCQASDSSGTVELRSSVHCRRAKMSSTPPDARLYASIRSDFVREPTANQSISPGVCGVATEVCRRETLAHQCSGDVREDANFFPRRMWMHERFSKVGPRPTRNGRRQKAQQKRLFWAEVKQQKHISRSMARNLSQRIPGPTSSNDKVQFTMNQHPIEEPPRGLRSSTTPIKNKLRLSRVRIPLSRIVLNSSFNRKAGLGYRNPFECALRTRTSFKDAGAYLLRQMLSNSGFSTSLESLNPPRSRLCRVAKLWLPAITQMLRRHAAINYQQHLRFTVPIRKQLVALRSLEGRDENDIYWKKNYSCFPSKGAYLRKHRLSSFPKIRSARGTQVSRLMTNCPNGLVEVPRADVVKFATGAFDAVVPSSLLCPVDCKAARRNYKICRKNIIRLILSNRGESIELNHLLHHIRRSTINVWNGSLGSPQDKTNRNKPKLGQNCAASICTAPRPRTGASVDNRGTCAKRSKCEPKNAEEGEISRSETRLPAYSGKCIIQLDKKIRAMALLVDQYIARIIFFLFVHFVLPLLRRHFYITVNESSGKRLRYYRKPIWKILQSECSGTFASRVLRKVADPETSTLYCASSWRETQSKKFCLSGLPAKVKKLSRPDELPTSKRLAVCFPQVQWIPKSSGFRPLINLSGKGTGALVSSRLTYLRKHCADAVLSFSHTDTLTEWNNSNKRACPKSINACLKEIYPVLRQTMTSPCCPVNSKILLSRSRGLDTEPDFWEEAPQSSSVLGLSEVHTKLRQWWLTSARNPLPKPSSHDVELENWGGMFVVIGDLTNCFESIPHGAIFKVVESLLLGTRQVNKSPPIPSNPEVVSESNDDTGGACPRELRASAVFDGNQEGSNYEQFSSVTKSSGKEEPIPLDIVESTFCRNRKIVEQIPRLTLSSRDSIYICSAIKSHLESHMILLPSLSRAKRLAIQLCSPPRFPSTAESRRVSSHISDESRTHPRQKTNSRNHTQRLEHLFKQVHGLPQGSVLSTILCALYYSSKDFHPAIQLLLQGSSNNDRNSPDSVGETSGSAFCINSAVDERISGNSSHQQTHPSKKNLLIRWVDDFLFISERKADAIQFVDLLLREKLWGENVNCDKFRTINFSYTPKKAEDDIGSSATEQRCRSRHKGDVPASRSDTESANVDRKLNCSWAGIALGLKGKYLNVQFVPWKDRLHCTVRDTVLLLRGREFTSFPPLKGGLQFQANSQKSGSTFLTETRSTRKVYRQTFMAGLLENRLSGYLNIRFGGAIFTDRQINSNGIIFRNVYVAFRVCCLKLICGLKRLWTDLCGHVNTLYVIDLLLRLSRRAVNLVRKGHAFPFSEEKKYSPHQSNSFGLSPNIVASSARLVYRKMERVPFPHALNNLTLEPRMIKACCYLAITQSVKHRTGLNAHQPVTRYASVPSSTMNASRRDCPETQFTRRVRLATDSGVGLSGFRHFPNLNQRNSTSCRKSQLRLSTLSVQPNAKKRRLNMSRHCWGTVYKFFVHLLAKYSKTKCEQSHVTLTKPETGQLRRTHISGVGSPNASEVPPPNLQEGPPVESEHLSTNILTPVRANGSQLMEGEARQARTSQTSTWEGGNFFSSSQSVAKLDPGASPPVRTQEYIPLTNGKRKRVHNCDTVYKISIVSELIRFLQTAERKEKHKFPRLYR